jgi:hypothetical protein
MSKYTIIIPPGKPCEVTERTGEITFEGEDLQVSDGYHTMDELYEHRHALFLALCKIYDNYITPLNSRVRCWKSKKHADGSEYEGWFILGMTVEDVQPFNVKEPKKPDYQISYHLPMKHWDLAKVIERPTAPKWDGHTSQDVIHRLIKL